MSKPSALIFERLTAWVIKKTKTMYIYNPFAQNFERLDNCCLLGLGFLTPRLLQAGPYNKLKNMSNKCS